MNTDSIPTRYAPELTLPGDFTFSENFDTIYLILPGTKHPDALSIQDGAPGGPRIWGWDGNVEKPTLQPSIHAPGEWHGYLVEGELRSC